MGQGEEVGEHEHAVDGVVLLVELGDREHEDGADDVDLGAEKSASSVSSVSILRKEHG